MTDFLDLNERVLSEIRSAADIIDVIGEHTTLKKAGKSWKGLCPFHKEKTPSFTVDRDRGLFYCFGCGVGGDVFKFVREIERADFREAAESLARRYGISIPRRSRGPADDRRETLYAAAAAAHLLYRENLWKSENAASRYLESRAVPVETARELELGFAPDAWDFISQGLSGAFSPELLIEAGLLQPGADGKRPYDRFRGRLLFPIRDEKGRVVAFGGRSLSGEEPKYLNSPETPIFSKNRVLYALTLAREAMRQRDRAILVEGYFDHLALYLAGLAETVATMGTALGSAQAQRLRRTVARVIVCYDADSAGKTATRRAIPILLAEGLEVAVVRLPAGLDPHDFYQASGSEAVTEAVENSAGFLDWLVEEEGFDGALSPEEKGGKIRGLQEILDAVPDRVLRYEYSKKLGARCAIPIDILWKDKGLLAAPRSAAAATKAGPETFQKAPLPAVERRLFNRLAAGGVEMEGLFSQLEPEVLSDERSRRLYEALQSAHEANPGADLSQAIQGLADDLAALFSEAALEEEIGGEKEGIEYIIRGLKKRYLDRQAQAVQNAIAAAEVRGDREEISRLYRSKLALLQESRELAREGARRKTC